MADSLETIKAKRLFERKRKYELEKYLKHVKTCLEILQDLKYEGQEIMVAGDKEDETENVSEWFELLDEPLVRFDTRRKVQEKNGRRGEDRRNEDGGEEKGF